MKLYLYNTLNKTKEVFTAINAPKVKIYTCGPTVYSHTHLGHMRTYTNTDILRRVLRYFEFDPFQVMNITDVGHLTGDRNMGKDKMEEAARREKLNAWQITEKYTKEFFDVLNSLNISRPDIVAKATDNIQAMILLVQALEKKGYTYRISDGLYFDTAKLNDYGKLANVDLKDLKEGARVEVNAEKRNPTDFALWKFTPPGVSRQMEWKSPWAEKSFPGWHIECSTLAMKFLSSCFSNGKFYPKKFQTIDIHTGGIEHINIHHTNEIAQTESATGQKFVNYWLHNNWLQVDGEKMSKSKGNFYTRDDLSKKGYRNLMSLRYLFLNTHYRKKMNFTWEALAGAKKAWRQLVNEVKGWQRAGEKSNKNIKEINLWQNSFRRAVADDLNMPQGLAVLWQVTKSDLLPEAKLALIKEFDQVLRLDLIKAAEQKQEIPKKVIQFAEERLILRNNNNWQKADVIRKKIEKAGYEIEDTAGGFRLKKKH